MRALRWTPEAVRDLVRLRAFLGEKNAVAAERAAVRIRQAAAALREQPELGRIVEGEAFRDLVAPFGGGAYVLRYRIDEDAVVIARVWHGREDRECTAGRFAPDMMSSDAVVWRRSWNRIGRTSALTQSFRPSLGHRRWSWSAALSTWPPFRRRTCR